MNFPNTHNRAIRVGCPCQGAWAACLVCMLQVQVHTERNLAYLQTWAD